MESRRTIPSVVHEHAHGAQRKAIALEVWDEDDGVTMSVTFAQLSMGVHSAAAFLMQVGGLAPGDACALHSHNTVAYVCASLGAMELGAVSMNLSWRQPDSINLGLLASLDAKLLLHSHGLSSLAELAAHDVHCEGIRIMLFESICATPLHTAFPFGPLVSGDSSNNTTGLASETPAAVFFTGGTTGTPKAVPHTHETLLSMVDGYLREHGAPLDPRAVGERAGSVCFAPYFHVMGYVCCLVVNLVAGCRSAIVASADTKLSASLMLAACRGLRPTVCHTVPVVVEGLVRMIRAGDGEAATELAKLHLFTYGGAALPEEHARALAQKGVTLQCAYGQTELCGPVCYGQQGSVHPLYRPLDGIGYELVREEGDAPDEGSLVLLGATSATPGYLNASIDLSGGGSSTHERYLTGDRFARERVAGQPGEWLRYLSRKDDILTHSSGEMTNPLITEQLILDEAGSWLSQGGVVVCGANLPRPVLVLELPLGVIENPRKLNDESMRAALRAAVHNANALQPTYSAVLTQNVWLVPAASLPRTVKGTIQRKPIEAMLKTGPPADGAIKLEEAAAAEYDSMSLTANAEANSEAFVTMHLYAVGITTVVYYHYLESCFTKTMNDTILADVAQVVNMDRLPLFPIFCVVAGAKDFSQRWPWRSIVKQVSVHLVCVCLLVGTYLPYGAIKLHEKLWDAEALLTGEYDGDRRFAFGGHVRFGGFRFQNGRWETRHPPVAIKIVWWSFAISCWKLLGLLAKTLRLPRWTLPIVALYIHFARCTDWVPQLLQSRSQTEVEPQKWSVVDLTWAEFSFCHLSEYWLFYATIPMLLPHRFPAELPLPPLPLAWKRCVSPHRFWPVLAAVLYACGWLVGSIPIGIFPISDLTGSSLWMQVLTLYRLKCHTASVSSAQPVAAITRFSYSNYFEGFPWDLEGMTLEQLAPFGIMPHRIKGSYRQCWQWPKQRHPFWSPSLACLDMVGVFYCTVLVFAAAALVPRRRTRFLTTAGSGSLAVYYLQGLLFPLFASPLYHLYCLFLVSVPGDFSPKHPGDIAPPSTPVPRLLLVFILPISLAYFFGFTVRGGPSPPCSH